MSIVIDARDLEPPEPFERVMEALCDMQPGDDVVLILTREPYPLYRVLEKNGFQRDHVSTLDVHGTERRLQHWSLSVSNWREHRPDFAPVEAEIRLR